MRRRLCPLDNGGAAKTNLRKKENRMSYVLVRHKVANYAKWKRVVQAAKPGRKASGEKSFQVFRSSSAPNDLAVVCRWDSTARMRRFVESAEPRERMKQAGVAGRLEILYFSVQVTTCLAAYNPSKRRHVFAVESN